MPAFDAIYHFNLTLSVTIETNMREIFPQFSRLISVSSLALGTIVSQKYFRRPCCEIERHLASKKPDLFELTLWGT
jgi:hypothetical protein